MSQVVVMILPLVFFLLLWLLFKHVGTPRFPWIRLQERSISAWWLGPIFVVGTAILATALRTVS